MGTVASQLAVQGGRDLLRPYVPRLLVEWLRDHPADRWHEVDGTLAFVDISGFTTLTERLARKGRIGAEEMSDILSATFGALLAVAYEDGAGLVKWGGDAILLLFQGDEHAPRAARAAFRMRQALREVGRIATSAGVVTLRMSVGLHSGTFHFFLVGDPELHRELLVSGPAASRTAEVESVAKAGEIGLSAQTAALLPSRLVRAGVDGVSLLAGTPVVDTQRSPPLPPTEGLDLAGTFSAPIREHLLAGAGEPEHRAIAVAFVQFSGTDHLLATGGAQTLADALDECVRNVQEACHRHGVTFFETDINVDGGKIMLVAGAPLSGGRNEERLLLAARLILDRPGALPLRAGVNAGPIFAGDFGPRFRRTYSVKGDAINLAARVMAKAQPGQLLATQQTLAASPAEFDTEPLAPFLVKGKSQPVLAASVGPVLSRGAAATDQLPLLGREVEVAALTQALDRATSRQGSVVELVGEPGIGKSRLADEARALALASGFVVLSASCGEYESMTPYVPVRQLLLDVVGVAADEDPGVLLRRLVDRVAIDHGDLLPWLPLLGVPLDVELPGTPETLAIEERFRAGRVREVTIRFLDAVLPTATLLVIEDAQLMDEASAEVFALAAAGIVPRPWVLLVTRRDRETGFVPLPAGADGAAAVSLRPEPLADDVVRALIARETRDAPLPPHQVAALAARSGGNPLFLHSLVQAAGAGGIDDELPDSLEELVTSQLDRLPSGERTLLRFAAVLGVTFAEDQLRLVLGDEQLPTGRSTMRRLSAFLEPAGHGRFRFRNAVIRDTAYHGLSYRRRKELHGRVGELLEAQAGDDMAEMLSLHYLYAGRPEKAWHFSRVAGDRAKHGYAYAEAAAFFRRAVEASRRFPALDPVALAEVHEALGDAQLRIGAYAEARTHFRTARARLPDAPVHAADLLLKEALLESRQGRLSQSLRVLTQAMRVLDRHPSDTSAGDGQRSMLESNYAWCRYQQGRYREALRWGRAAEVHALAAGDRAALAEAYVVLQAVAAWSRHAHDRPYGDLALALYEELGDRLQAANVLNNMAGSAFFEGRWSDALVMFEGAHRGYLAAGDALGAAIATFNVADIELRQNRIDEAEARLHEVRAIVGGLGEPTVTAAAVRELGRALVLSGRLDEGRALLDAAVAAFAKDGEAYEELVAQTGVIEHLLRVADAAEALERAELGLARALALDAVTLLATFRRLRADALLASGRADEAHAELGRALSELDGQGAHERGFLLQGLARTGARVGDPQAAEYAEQAYVELARLGVRVEPSD